MRNTDHIRNAEIAEAYASGKYLVTHIAAKYGIKRRRVQQIAKQYGVVRTKADANRAATPLKTKHRIRIKNRAANPNFIKVGRVPVTPNMRRHLLAIQPYCRQCHCTTNLEVDHVDNDPMNTVLSNLQVLCGRCNYLKAQVFKREQKAA